MGHEKLIESNDRTGLTGKSYDIPSAAPREASPSEDREDNERWTERIEFSPDQVFPSPSAAIAEDLKAMRDYVIYQKQYNDRYAKPSVRRADVERDASKEDTRQANSQVA